MSKAVKRFTPKLSWKQHQRFLEKQISSTAIRGSETDHLIEQFFASLDTPKSLAAWMLYKYNEHTQLLDLDVNPTDYLTADLFHRDYMACAFLSKSDFLKTGYDKRQRAFDKFQKMERQCAETNLRFSRYEDLEKSPYATLLFVMKRKIDLILGSFSAEELFKKSSWGPGSTTRISGNDVGSSRKFQSEIGMTRSLYTLFASSISEAYPHWFDRERLADSSFPFEEGNTVTTVPKNSKTDRVIAIEPGVNLWFQKGLGACLRTRLQRWGVNLNDQGRNQFLSRRGSLSGTLATVDFSSASDSIAFRLVEELLPKTWFQVMNSCRSSTGSLDGKKFAWEKFSSMGNGFTFELESLIFYAAALAVAEQSGVSTGEISVYGDDVIIPVSIYASYSDFCAFLGFTVNPDKSFSVGRFRESCGAHWFGGIDVKPLFLKERLSHVSDVFKLANSVRRLAHRRNNYYGCDRGFLQLWRSITSRVPTTLRSLRISDGFGDGGLISNFDEACPAKLKHQLEGYSTLHATEIGKKIYVEHHGLFLDKLHLIDSGAAHDVYNENPRKGIPSASSLQVTNNSVTLRNRTRWRVSRLCVTSWYDLGPWI